MNTLRKLARYIKSSSSGSFGQIDARLGRQTQRVVMLFHPGDDLFQERLGLLLVSDEVVVDDESGVEPGSAHVVQFGHQLVRVLHSRLAPEDHDDVAELALKWTASRVLQCPRRVAIDLEQVISRAWDLGHVGRL